MCWCFPSAANNGEWDCFYRDFVYFAAKEWIFQLLEYKFVIESFCVDVWWDYCGVMATYLSWTFQQFPVSVSKMSTNLDIYGGLKVLLYYKHCASDRKTK